MRKKFILFFHNHSFLRWIIPIFHYFFGNSRFKHCTGNTLDYTTANIYRSSIDFGGHKDNQIYIGPQTDFHHSKILIKGCSNSVHIGQNCFINGLTIVIEGSHNTVFIGDNAFILDDTRFFVVDGTALRMGKNCMFSDRIEIRTTDNHSIYSLSDGKRINFEEDVAIGDNVWVGTGVRILKGTTIPDGCIVGAGSILTKKYTIPHSIIVGNPGRIIKQQICWTMERGKQINISQTNCTSTLEASE